MTSDLFATLVGPLMPNKLSTAGVMLVNPLLACNAMFLPAMTIGIGMAARVARGRLLLADTALVPLRLVKTTVQLFPVRTVLMIVFKPLLIVLTVPTAGLNTFERFITLGPVKPRTTVLHPLLPTLPINVLFILQVSTLGPKLQAVIPGEGTRTCFLFLKGLRCLLPTKKAIRGHPLALVTCSRERPRRVNILFSIPATGTGPKVTLVTIALRQEATAINPMPAVCLP